MPREADALASLARRRAIAWRVGLPVLLITLLLVVVTVQLGMETTRTSFNEQLNELALLMEQRLEEARSAAIVLAALHQVSFSLQADDIAAFARDVNRRFRFAESIAFLQVVPAAERALFEGRMEEEGYPGFTILDPAGEGRLEPAAKRDRYLPIRFFEPLTPENARWLGLDLSTVPEFASAIDNAIATNEVVISRPFSLFGDEPRVALFKAAYKGKEPPATVTRRRRHLAAIYAVIVHPRQLFSSLLPTIGVRSRLSRISLVIPSHGEEMPAEPLIGISGKAFDTTESLLPPLTGSRFLLSNWQNVRLRLDQNVLPRDYNLHIALIEGVGGVLLFALFYVAHRQRFELLLKEDRMRQDLFRQRELAETTLHAIADGVISVDADNTVDYANRPAIELLARETSEVVGEPLDALLVITNEEGSIPPLDPVAVATTSNIPVRLRDRLLILPDSGQRRIVNLSVSARHDSDGKVVGAILTLRDLSSQRKIEQRLEFQRRHDQLTGLYNRKAMEHEIELSLERIRRGEHGDTLCYIDLDRFKTINDTCGHGAGDELLRQISRLLQAHLRRSDFLARLGGDEFGVLLRHCNDDIALRIANNLRDLIRDYEFRWKGKAYKLGASIGLVEINGGMETVSDVLKAVDSACYMAKDQGRDQVYRYKPGDSRLAERHAMMWWVHRIQDALDENRFHFVAQRIVPVDPASGPEHLELLLRMHDEDGTTIPPMSFIPAAESYGLMGVVDRWVIRNALPLIARNARGDQICNINLSGQSLHQEGFAEYVIEQIHLSGVKAGNICFEVTETAAIDNRELAIDFMERLKEIGCLFALDDFGSGLSSLGYLRDFPVDYLKIDGQFIRNLAEDRINQAMVGSVAQIAHVMGIRTIAEFVENEKSLEMLRELGVDFAQGYHIHKPEGWPKRLSPAQIRPLAG